MNEASVAWTVLQTLVLLAAIVGSYARIVERITRLEVKVSILWRRLNNADPEGLDREASPAP
jgi:hypothetical protein